MTQVDAGARAKEMAEKNECQLVDIKFADLHGQWQHFTMPIKMVEFNPKESFPFDGSSIRGFQEIDESDMYLIPDYESAFVDPFTGNTLSVICDVFDPIKKQFYSRDSRVIAKKAQNYLKTADVGDTVYFGPEAEFFIFDDLRYAQNSNSGYYFIDSSEGIWNSGNESQDGKPNLAYKPRHKEGYFPVPPHDATHDLRNEMIMNMMDCGLNVEKHHHEVATAGQCEIGLRFDTLVNAADDTQIYKYVVKNTARENGKIATFMPKPLFGDNGSGMHVHQSIWKDGKNLFYGGEDKYGKLSQTAIYYIGGLLEHARSLAAICSPTTNSYKRLVPGFEAPVNLVYSHRNRSASVRVPVVESEKAVRVEFRCPDPSANPYLVFSALLMAGLDGIKRKTMPPEPVDTNLYKLPKEKLAQIRKLPGSLKEALEELQSDHKFLLEGDVFTKDVIET